MRRWRPVAFAGFERSARVLELTARALRCLGVGLLDHDALRAHIERRWQAFYTSEEDVHSGLFDWERRLYGRFVSRGDRVLLIGSGSGRDLLALLERGVRVEALELSAVSAAIAARVLARRGLSAPIAVGAVEKAALGGPYDAVIFSWYCYSYIPGAAARIAVLEKARAALGPHGRVLLSAIVQETGSPVPLILMRAAARLSGSSWRPEPGDAVDGSRFGLNFEHRFRPGELAREAAAAGLSITFLGGEGEDAALVPATPVSSASAPAGRP